MATDMPAPSKEAVLLAMRSDLGMGRVDDLELENGRRGHTIRPGQASQVLPAKAVAPPRKILPVANKWKTAIEKGAFDDDDADAVKGLDRIGGGRLHSLNSTPSFPAQNFSSSRLPPPGLRPPGFAQNRTPVSLRMPPNIAPIPQGLDIVDNEVSRRLTGHSPAPLRVDRGTLGMVKSFGAKPVSSRISPLPPRATRIAQDAGKKSSRSPAPEPSSPPLQILRPQDPEPAEYVYKETICVADRLAKGDGAVYLVAPSHTDPGTFHIYLEGSKYLEYPVLSMYNYIATSTELCPQFKEADGVSITTTSLVFGSQEKIAKFMKIVKTLKARKPAAVSTTTQASASAKPVKPTNPAATNPADGPVSGSRDKSLSLKPIAKERTPAKSPSSTAATSRHESDSHGNYDIKPPTIVLQYTSNTMPDSEHNSPAPAPDGIQVTHEQDGYGMACDLLDLSQPAEKGASMPAVRSDLSSAYAMDLGSLQCSLFDTPAESFASNDGLGELQESIDQAEVGSPHTETPTETSQVHEDLPPNPIDQTESLESLRHSLVDILPKFEAMSKILDSIDEKDREVAAKAVFANLRAGQSDANNIHLSSAEQLLRALLIKPTKRNPATTSTKVADSESHLRYERGDIMRLRDQAVPPPELLFKLPFLPRTTTTEFVKPGICQARQQTSLSNVDKIKKSVLHPKAEPFRPSQVTETKNSEPSPQFVSSVTAPETQATKQSPTALSHMSNSSNSTNTDSLTAGMSHLALPDTKAKPPAKGLQGSRWATTSDSACTENANNFTSIANPF